MKDFKNWSDMPKDWMEHKVHKLYHKRNFLFKAFLINYVAVFVAWCISGLPWYQGLLLHFMQTDAGTAHMYMMNMFGFWKIAGVVLFLVPAFAAWWEMASCRKYLMAGKK